jgi:hypothetical protein
MPGDRNRARRRLAAAGGLTAALLAPTTGWVGAGEVAQEALESSDLEAQRRSLEELRHALEEQKRRLDAERRALEEQQLRLEALQRQLHEQTLDRPLSAQRQGELRGGQAASQQGPQQAPPAQQAPQAQQQGPQAQQQRPQAQQQQGASPAQPPAQQTQSPQAPPRTVGQAPKPSEKPPEVAPIFQQPGVLTPKGKLVLEPSLQYSYASNNRVALIGFTIIPAITIGLIDIRGVNRSAYTAALTARYGVTNRLEVEVRVPYVYRHDSTVSRPANLPADIERLFSASGDGIGDVEVAARYQFNQGGMEKPYYVGTLRIKARNGRDIFEVPTEEVFPGRGQFAGRLPTELPTGTGFVGIQPGLTVIYPSDPAVFFGSLTYLWNIERTDVTLSGQSESSDVDAGDAVGFNFGMGLALNERASFSIGYDHSIFGKTKVNGAYQSGEVTAQLGTLLLGYSYRLKKNTNFNLSVGFGVTDEAPDVQLTVRMPITLGKTP